MEIQEAIDSHIAWKHRLFIRLRSSQGKALSPEEVGSAEDCPLGRWIDRQVQNDLMDVLFVKLLDDHREFHRLAASLIQPESDAPSETQTMLLEGRIQELSDKITETLHLLAFRGKHDPRGRALEKSQAFSA